MKILIVDDKEMIPVMTCVIREITRFMGLEIELVGTESCVDARRLLSEVDVVVIDTYRQDRQDFVQLSIEHAKPIIVMHSLYSSADCPTDTQTLRFIYKLECDISLIEQALRDFKRILKTRNHKHLAEVIAHGLVYPNPLN